MLVQVRDFVNVAARARELGCHVPVKIALLPGNFSAAASTEEFRYHAATPHVRAAWWSVGLEDEGPALSDGDRRGQPTPVRAVVAGSDAPSAQVPLAVFFGVGLLGGPMWCLSVALGMVSSVLAFQPGCASTRDVRLDTIVERPGGGCVCLEYRGDAYGLVALTRDVRRIWAGK